MNTIEKFKYKLEREMKSGFIALIILYIINEKDEAIYGYKIIKYLKEITQGKFNIREGTVYPILHFFQTQDFLTSYLGESPNGAPRKYYFITKEGEAALDEGLQSWQQFREVLDGIFQKSEGK